MKKDLGGKVVIVTGASSGIGKACAFEFARRGSKIVLAARNIEQLRNATRELSDKGYEASYVQTDVSLEEDCKRLIGETLNKYGRIDVLINNAGISMRAMFNELNLDVLKTLMDTNYWGMVYCTKYALPHLLKEKGVLIGVSSISALTPLPGRTGYCASKFAFNGFLSTLRLEHYKDGLNVLIVHPGFTSSNIRSNALNGNGEIQKESPRNEDKMMPAEEVARRIVVATNKGSRELILTSQGKWLVFLYKFFPSILDRIIYKQMAREQNAPFK